MVDFKTMVENTLEIIFKNYNAGEEFVVHFARSGFHC